MSRILFAWELGANLGHLLRLAPIAQALRSRGHEVMFAVRDTRGASMALGGHGLPFVQAPALARRPRTRVPPGNFAEMLLAEGYADGPSLQGAVRGWVTLAQLFRAGLIVADHAPTALLAARALGAGAVQIGNGFDMPPLVAPLPSIRPWEEIPQRRLARSEHVVTDSMNAVLRDYGVAEMTRVADLFDVNARLLATFPEIDAFGRRPDGDYIGPIYDSQLGELAQWPEGEGPRAFAYLRASVPGAGNILQALKASALRTVCVMPDIGPDAAAKLGADNLRIETRPLRLSAALARAELAVLYASHGALSAALAAGVPQLNAPQNVEQFLHAKRIEALGAGITLETDRRTATVSRRIAQALADARMKAKAQSFAAAHAGYDPAQTVAECARRIEEAARGGDTAARRGNRGKATVS